MAQIGNSNLPGTGYFYDDTGNSQFMSGAYQMPSGGGFMTDVYVYVAGDGGIANGQLAVWDWGGALKWNSGNFNFSAGSRAIHGQAWQHIGGLNVWLPFSSNGGYGIGCWTDGGIVWTYESSGVVDYQRGIAGGPTTMAPPGTEGGGAFGAYLLYNPLNAPTISNANPSVGPAGSTVVLTGTNFLQVSGITCCGIAVTSYTVNSSTQITLTVPAGAVGVGTIVVTNPAGSGSIAFTAGTIWTNVGSGVVSIKNVWTNVGSGVVKVAGIWTNSGSGNKRIW